MTGKNEKTEVLAPAGSYDIMTAVFSAGADAVYLGGDLFGARAYAGNFNQEELLRALDYAHLRGKKIYMTVNTLLKEQELSERLTDYLAPYYEAGLDAAIVQDLGVFQTLRDNFPDLPLHASTQMTVTGSRGALLLKQMGAARIVTARELSLSELKQIHTQCEIEIESFVHGALCYSYSGQCLFSSMNGRRSGNRGRCAQPCRLDYHVLDSAGQTVNNAKTRYALSPKDLCALQQLPEILEAGVHALKIEGRMKNATYAAGVTAIYRKYADLYQELGKSGYRVLEQDVTDLLAIYNRGGFTGGYYTQDKGRQMMSLSRPNHMGTAALKVLKNKNGCVTFQALAEIRPQDVFEIDAQHSFSSGDVYPQGVCFEVNLPRKYPLPPGKVLYRMRSQAVTDRVAGRFTAQKDSVPVRLSLEAVSGQPMALTMQLCAQDRGAFVKQAGAVVQPAVQQPADRERTVRQLARLGNTPFTAKEVQVRLGENVFLPVAQLNDLRRAAAEQLTEVVLSQYRRKRPEVPKKTPPVKETEQDGLAVRRSVLAVTKEQALLALESDLVDSVYYDFTLFAENCDIMDCGKERVLVLPYIVREKNGRRCAKLIQKAAAAGADAFLVRNLEEIGLLAELAADPGYSGTRRIIADAGLYCWNSAAAGALAELAERSGLSLCRITLPYELTADELAQIRTPGIAKELIVYGRIPLMVSEQCIRRTFGCCDPAGGQMSLADSKNSVYSVRSICSYCYNVIYSAKPLDLTAQKEQIRKTGAKVLRYDFTEAGIAGEAVWAKANPAADPYYGHFKTGVE